MRYIAVPRGVDGAIHSFSNGWNQLKTGWNQPKLDELGYIMMQPRQLSYIKYSNDHPHSSYTVVCWMEQVQTKQEAGTRVHLHSKLESSLIYKVANNKYLHAGSQLWIAVLALYKQIYWFILNTIISKRYFDILMWSSWFTSCGFVTKWLAGTEWIFKQ